jgi:predicted dehydrogenase
MKALFVGVGSIGQRHLRNLKAIAPNIEVMAVRSLRTAPVLSNVNNIVNNITIAEQYNLKEFDSFDVALEMEPDIVFVTNPTSLHIDVAIKAIKAGCYVFIEKPLSHTWDGVEELIRLENEIGEKRVAVGYQFRYHPALDLIKKLLNEKSIGNIVNASFVNGEYMPGWHPYEDYRSSYAVSKELGGGALVTQIHDFDYAMWLFGQPSHVFSVGGKISELEMNVEDSVQVLMQFQQNNNPLPVTISLDYLQWPSKRTINIVGDRGSIQCDLTKNEVIVNNRVNNHIEEHKFPDFDRNELFIREMNNFLAFVRGDEEPTIDLQSSVSSLRVALAARNSMNTEQNIELSWDRNDRK